MIGHELIPLNEMDGNSDLYKGHAKKYVGREDLMLANIPRLNCKWNDVVQCSALSPQIIVNCLKKYDSNLRFNRFEYYKIPTEYIEVHHEAVLFDRKKRKKGNFEIFESEVKDFSKFSYKELNEVPVETIEFWNKLDPEKEKYLWFAFIPHVLIKGKVDVKEFEIETLKL